MPNHLDDFQDSDFKDDDTTPAAEVEVLAPGDPGSGLARPLGYQAEDPGEKVRRVVEAQLGKARAAMELRWEDERKLREKWNAEDKLEHQRVKLTAMIAGAVISEGMAGVRMRSDQVASMACEYADEILKELAKYHLRDQKKREAERVAAGVAADQVKPG